MSSFTISSMQAIAIIPMFTGTFSFIASILVLYMIWRSYIKLSTTYHRLMVGVCCSDLILSLSHSLSSLLAPKDAVSTSHMNILYTFGNQLSCDVQGFIHVLGLNSLNLYLCGLTGYFLLAIHINLPDDTITKYYEPAVHGLAIGYALFAAIFSLVYDGGNYFPTDNMCWIAPKPMQMDMHCTESDGGDIECDSVSTRDQNDATITLLRWFFLAGPTLLSFIVISINMLIIFWTLMDNDTKGSISVGASITANPRCVMNGGEDEESELNYAESSPVDEQGESSASMENPSSTCLSSYLYELEEGAPLPPVTAVTPNAATAAGDVTPLSSPSIRMNLNQAQMSPAERKPSLVQLYNETKKKSKKKKKPSKSERIRIQGMQQCIFYICMYLVCNILPFFQYIDVPSVPVGESAGNRDGGSDSELNNPDPSSSQDKTYITLRILQQILNPLQGVIIFAIFIRPRISTILHKNKSLSRWQALIRGIQSKGEAPNGSLRRRRRVFNPGPPMQRSSTIREGRVERRSSETFNMILS